MFTINSDQPAKDIALYMSSSSYYKCVKTKSCSESYELLSALDENLNKAAPSLPGILVKFKKSNSIYYYMCSRNNNFSNRSQKGSITIA